MKGLTSTIALAAILAALGGYIYFVEMKKPASSEPPKAKVFSVEAGDIEDLSVKAASGDTTHLQKINGSWAMVEPVKADADATEPVTISSSLSSIEIERVIDENPASLKEYGLDPPRIDIAFKAKGDKDARHLLIGDKAPAGGNLYAMRQGEKKVFLLSGFLENTLNRTSFDLRDKSIVKFDRGKVDSIEISQSGKTLQFVKHGEAEWNVMKPVAVRGDFGSIDGVLSSLSSTQVQKFIATEATDLAQYGLAKPELTVTLAGGGSQSALLIGKAAEGTRYAKDSNRPVIFTVGDNLLKDLQKDVADFRRKDIFEFRAFNANRVEFRRGADTIALEKTKDKDGKDVWKTAAGKALDSAKAEDPLMKFANLRADAFESTPPAALKSPELTITAQFDDSKKTDVVRFAKSGADVYAVRDGEPGAAKLPAAAYDEALKGLDALK